MPWRFKPDPPAMRSIKESADYGSDETQHSGNGRCGDGNGRSVAPACSAD